MKTSNHFSTILQTIHNKRQTSVSEISRITSINCNTIKESINRLIQQGLIIKVGIGPSSGGRRPVLYELNSPKILTIGVEVRNDFLNAALINAKGDIITTAKKEDVVVSNSEKSIESITEIINKLTKGNITTNIKAIGIGIPWLVMYPQESVYNHINNKEFSIKEALEERFNLPVSIDETANVGALAEKMYGIAKDNQKFLYIEIRNGVGMGVFYNGILRGKMGFAGELGHMVVDNNGLQCECAKSGCLNTIVTDRYIVSKARSALRNGVNSLILDLVNNDMERLTPEIVFEAALQRDRLALQIVNMAGEGLGKALSILINLFNPEAIVINGKLSMLDNAFMDSVKRIVRNNVVEKAFETTDIGFSKLGEGITVKGAALLALQRVLKKAALLIGGL